MYKKYIYFGLLIAFYNINSASIESYNKKHEEYQYLDLVKHVIENGEEKEDRTGIGTKSIFGAMMRFDLSKNKIPVLTTKRVFWKGVLEELLWFIKGSTNAKELSDKGVTIWNANGSREFLDKRGLKNREEGDLGPVYGFQWRHFGAKYIDMHTDYTGQGEDQLMRCINTIKTNPNDRRIIISAWNPCDLDLMALPPCHMFCQFYVAKGKLSLSMYQRSADLGLGVPFNIASYSLLLHLVAQCTNLQPGEFIYMIGDAHVYLNHIEALKKQITRSPKDFPTISLDKSIKDIDSFKSKHIKLVDYNPEKSIKMDMAV